MAQRISRRATLGLGALLLVGGTAAQAASSASALAFDKSNYTTITITVDSQTMSVRWYKELCYVANQQAMAATQSSGTIANPTCGYQSMNVFVPESAANDQKTAIYFAVNNAGWMSSYVAASVADGASFDSSTSNVGAALKAGYVYVDVGTRGRGITAADGSYAGKSPAAIVDAKAAVRYLRLNDAAMPGSAERIVVNGTSGGGALSAILGASGNSADYLPWLADIGAAGVDARGHSTLRDDVFAINAYCPITDLGNADKSYEWLYNVLGTRATVGTSNPYPAAAAQLMAAYPAYLRSLHLTDAAGQRITEANLLDEIRQEVIKSAVAYMKAGNTIPALGDSFSITSGGFPGGTTTTATYTNDWIDVDNTRKAVRSLDMTRYLAFVATQATLKGTPAFDAIGVSQSGGNTRAESTLFGTGAQSYSNFTDFSWNANDSAGDGVGLDDTGLTWARYVHTQAGAAVATQVRLIDPMAYIGGNDTAPFWYVRNGTRDRDSSFQVSYNLSRALAADRKVRDVDYLMAWNQPHGGNYDVPEAMAWIAKVLEAADARD